MMRQLSVLFKRKQYDIDIDLEKWEAWEKKDMPGISLGHLFTFRDEVEKEIEILTKVKMPYTYDEQGKANRLDEAWINIFYLFALVYNSDSDTVDETTINRIKKWKEQLNEIAFHAYYIIVKEMRNKYEQICINLDELPPSTGTGTGVYGR